MELLFASGNQNKVNELRKIVSAPYTILSLADMHFYEEIPETAATIEGNALLKARFCAAQFHKDCFADDTGLEVEALQGSPGVFSARYAGKEKNDSKNIELLLHNLHGEVNRKAQFKTVIALIYKGKEHLFTGTVEGAIRIKPSGKNGFGYDSIFEPEHCGKTFAEMSLDEKNKLSHRARAVEQLQEFLKRYPL